MINLDSASDIERENKFKKFDDLLKEERFPEAKKYADYLLKKEIPRTLINHRSYDYFKRLKILEFEKAEKLANIFEDYDWRSWLG